MDKSKITTLLRLVHDADAAVSGMQDADCGPEERKHRAYLASTTLTCMHTMLMAALQKIEDDKS